ncbi:hypothetical protein BST95_10835 [Halioglobus japonicus]|uniref:Alpha/beta hydrolase domain-containing protein n=1 Tax=Halioglobus japonicus TaxID=930805 RepID=A0AAP8SNJ1_9GAMM|nr:alpha/beta hydrolase domain-containing protein [Halioglobus japonicus]AQA18658.1 hypothetical protein BST95_10835 [Halioglobus japonicus]PLW86687.1 hypothetical protein C0029_09855 [Halioglobus japonicus]GHD11575.1 hypothetical protein GCM10007052_11490 [Halioglobus japonicus]
MFVNTLRLSTLLCSAALAITLAACSDNSRDRDAGGDTLLPVSNPVVSLPPDVGNINLLALNIDLNEVGYQQSEFFLEGSASAFRNTSELGEDGFWSAEPAETAEYRVRIVVYRPIDPANFDGNVLIEWLNVTAGFETPPSWGTGHLEMRRGGSVWVGVSAQFIGIEGSESSLLPLHLKAANPERYGSLLHPGDSFSFDIYQQVAQAIRSPQGIDPLEGLVAENLIAYGESQSAGRLTTYINAIHPLYQIFDGFMVHSRGDSGAPLAQEPLTSIPTPDVALIRTDVNVPVLQFKTETDVLLLGHARARQPDTDLIRTWEVTGTAHGDLYTFVTGRNDDIGAPEFASVREENTVLGFITCELPINNGPHHYVFNTAVHALNEWISDSILPPTSPRLTLNDDESDYRYDALGNVLGGIRTPYVDAPSAILLGNENPGDRFCFLFGTTSLFDAAQMASLYIDEAGYVAAVTEATNAAVASGFLLQADADAIIAWAPEQWREQVNSDPGI